MPITFRAAALSAGLVLIALPAGADMTAAELWRDWQTAADGRSVTAAGQTATAGGLALAGLRIDQQVETAAVTLGVETATLAEDGSGGVRVTLPADQVLSLEIRPGSGEITSARFRLTGSGVTLDASGTPGAVAYAVAAPEAVLGLVDLAIDGQPTEAGIDLALAALAGTIGAAGDASFAARSATLGMAFTDPATGSRVSSTTHQEAPTLAFVPGADGTGLPETGLPGAGRIETTGGALTSLSRQVEPTGAVTESEMRQTASRSTVNLESGRADLRSRGDGLALTITAPTLPASPATFAADSVDFSASLPLAPAAEAQPLTLAAMLDGLTVGPEVWALIDPSGAIPRDPGALVLDLEAAVKLDGPPPLPGVAPAIEPESLRVHRLTLDIAGASLDATGAFTFQPVAGPAGPDALEPVGRLELGITGVLGLLQSLVQAGAMTGEQATGLQMMIAMFARPGEGDSLTSTIVTEPGGGLTVNGTRLR